MRVAGAWLGAFLCFFVLGATWALGSPLLSVPDEPAHLVKSAAVARGQLTGEKMPIPDEGVGSIFRGGFTVVVDVPESYAAQTSEIPNCFIYEPTVPAGCAPAFRDRPDTVEWTTWVGTYPPTYYLAVGGATLLDTGRVGVYLARLWSAALSAGFLASAFAGALVAPRRHLALGVVLAATPMALFLAGSVNPNGLEISTAVCFWAALGTILTLDRRPPGALYAAALASGLVLAWTRPLSVAWLVLAAAVLALGFAGRPRETVERIGRRRVAGAAVAIGVVALVAVVWVLALDALGNVQGDEPRGLSLVRALRHAAGRTDDALRQMVGVFGWRSTFPPVWLAVAWLAAVALLVAAALWAGRRRARLAVVAAGVLAVVVPVVLEASQAHDRGFAWQGRYGLPLAVGVPITAALALDGGRVLDRRVSRALLGVVVAVVTLGHVVAHAASMRRYVVGSDGPWWYLSGDGWDPPLPAALLLVATLAGALGLAVLAVRVVAGAGAEGERAAATSAVG